MPLSISEDIFFKSLVIDKSFRTKVIQLSDVVLEAVYKYLGTPDCEVCKKDLLKSVSPYIDTINTFIPKPEVKFPTPVVEQQPLPEKPTITHQNQVKRVSGHVIEIKADPDEYAQVMDLAQQEKWMFRGLGIIEKKNEKSELVWVIYFY